MTSMQHSPSSEHGPDGLHPSNAHAAGQGMASGESTQPSFGSRLRAAREARGLDLEACATALRLPVRVLRKLELDQYDGTDSKVYLGSYIAKYGRHLGINEASVQLEVDRIRQVDTPLVTSGGISHSRFLFDRYATAATYVVLTLVIAVPTLWFGVKSTLDRDITHLAPLDAAPVAQQEPAAAAAVTTARHAAQPPATAAVAATEAEPEQPLLASMAPFPNLSSPAQARSPATPPVANSGGHQLELTLSSPSWVEVTRADGTRLEYGLLPAGSHTVYHSDQALNVSIGNVGGAQVVIDGQAIGLDDFRRANVAHFRMQVQDGKASATSL
ncbi:MAG: RodZ domain-containing protein [Rhodanobacter sp.]|jgi:cytoskeleton protein RodZ